MVGFWSICYVVVLCGLSTAYADDVNCNHDEGCAHDSMTNSHVYCGGFRSCHDSNIDSSYMVSSGDLANSHGDVESYYTYNYGRYSSYFADIKTILIENLGYYSASHADIRPYSSTLFAYFYGYYSGYHADVSCFDGDTCKIYCGTSNGCAKLNFYCYAGAVCHYDCGDESSYCPTVYSGVESQVTSTIGVNNKEEYISLSDDEITSFYKKNQILKREGAPSIPEISVDNNNNNNGKFENVEDAEETIRQEIENSQGKNGKKNKNNNYKNAIRVFAVEDELIGETNERPTTSTNKKNGGIMSQIKWKQYMVACIVDVVIFAVLYQAFIYIKRKRNVQLIEDLDEKQQRAHAQIDPQEYEHQQCEFEYQVYQPEYQDQEYHDYQDYQDYQDDQNTKIYTIHEQKAPTVHNEYSPLVH